MEGQGLHNILMGRVYATRDNCRMCINNQAAFVMATNPTYGRRTWNIEISWHYVRDQVDKGTVELWKVATADNPSDLLT